MSTQSPENLSQPSSPSSDTSWFGEWQHLMRHAQVALDDLNIHTPGSLDKVYFSMAELDSYHQTLMNHLSSQIHSLKTNEANDFLESFFVEAPVGFLILSEKGIIEDANQLAAEYWRVKRASLRRIGLLGLISSESVPVFSKALESAKLCHHRKTVDICCIRPESDTFWARFDLMVTRNPAGDKRKVLCSVMDITTDRIIEHTLKKTTIGLSAATGAEFFRQLVHFLVSYPSVDHAVVSEYRTDRCDFRTIAMDSNCRLKNTFCYKKPGLNVHKSHGKPSPLEPSKIYIDSLLSHFAAADGISIFLLDSDHQICGEVAILTNKSFPDDRLYASILKVISARSTAEIQRRNTELELKNHRDHLEEMIAKRTSDLQQKNLLLSHEIEKRMSVEEHLRRAKVQAEAATQTKGNFLANMSHELRTPLNGILGVTELLAGSSLSSKQNAYCETLKRSGHALLNIINDILDLSKIEAGALHVDRQEFSLKQLMQLIFDTHAYRAEKKGLYFSIAYPEGAPDRIIADPIRIRQVVENLLSNAIKFTHAGFVFIEVRFERHDIVVSVVDSGIGIAPEQQHRVFERFSQGDSSTTRKFGGTGLGLSISKRLAELLKGSLDLESQPGRGTTFLFRVPFVSVGNKQAVGNRGDKPGALPIAQSSKPRVLVYFKYRDFAEHVCLASRGSTYPSVSWQTVVDELEGGTDAKELAHSNLLSGVEFVLCDHEGPDSCDLDAGVYKPAEDCDDELPVRILKVSPGDLEIYSEPNSDLDSNAATQDLDSPQERLQLVLRGTREVARLKSTFLFGHFINALRPKEDSKRSAKTEAYHRVYQDEQVLLAEDNPVNRLVAVEMLKKLGAKVDWAEDGEKALELFKLKPYAIVFMDCLMPNMDGFQALQQIQALELKWKKPPVIALTANAMKGDREKCLTAGFDEYLAKPIAIKDLTEIGELFLAKAREVDKESIEGQTPFPVERIDVHSARPGCAV